VQAGDAFNAGFLSQFIKGASLEDAAKFGCATAAYSVMQRGASVSLADVASAAKLLAEHSAAA
jgi:ribokinase